MATTAAESSRLVLHPLTAENHLQDYHLIMSNPSSMMWSKSKPYTSISQTLALIEDSQPTRDRPWNRRWAIMIRRDTLRSPTNTISHGAVVKERMVDTDRSEAEPKLKMIGLVGIVREREIGYKLHPDFWGRGYMTEALALFVDMLWGLEETEYWDTILAAADTENRSSMRVLEKTGFKRGKIEEGIYERACLNGERKSDLQQYVLERPR